MFKNHHNKLVIGLILVILISCKTQQKAPVITPVKNIEKTTSEKVEKEVYSSNNFSYINGPVIVYKTRGDFYNNVPVIMSDDKMSVVSYPDIKDISKNGKLTYPTYLSNGYLLDHRGINKNVAFLKLTYEEYSKLPSTLRKEEVLSMIIERNPLLEMYSCDNLQIENTDKINGLIQDGLPKLCKDLLKNK